MLPEHRLKAFRELVLGASREERIWMNGFLAGLVQSEQESATTPAASSKPVTGRITIAYGSETGNSKKLATQLATSAKKKGINVKLANLDQYKIADLNNEEYFFVVISTQGDGEPPATAKKFYDTIHANGLQLSKLKYGVLALGDTAYPLFCKAGEDVDAQLQKLGGRRVLPLQKCDIDFAGEAGSWFDQVFSLLQNEKPAAPQPAAIIKKSSGKKYYKGTVSANIDLNDTGSLKSTHHIEISVEDELQYQPGDAAGIIPYNRKESVQQIIQLSELDPDHRVNYREEEYTLQALLQKRLNILHLPERIVKQYASIVDQEIPITRIDLYDLLRIYPVQHARQFEAVLQMLEPMQPRLYSIASSPAAHPGEIHLTVAADRFNVNEEVKHGLCSDFLLQLKEGDELDLYIHTAHHFRLPQSEKDMIMIGPGTGIAPFRSFLAERDATGAGGRNWLFFGEQHFTTDFLYQTELQDWTKTEVLTNISLAFSRDQQEKIYVQHRLLEQSAEVWNWIVQGAHLYICGAKDPMSLDVEDALRTIFRKEGGFTEQEAQLFLEKLEDTERYHKDVY